MIWPFTGRDADWIALNIEFTIDVMKGAAIINLFPMFIRPYVRFLSLPPFVHNIIIIVYIGLWDVYSPMLVRKLNELLSIWHLLFKTAEDISKNTEVTGKINQYVSLPRDIYLHSEQGTFSLTGRYVVLANGQKTERRRKFSLESHSSYLGN